MSRWRHWIIARFGLIQLSYSAGTIGTNVQFNILATLETSHFLSLCSSKPILHHWVAWSNKMLRLLYPHKLYQNLVNILIVRNALTVNLIKYICIIIWHNFRQRTCITIRRVNIHIVFTISNELLYLLQSK